MDALIKMVAEKTGISQQQAATAVQTVMGFLKDRLPAGVGEQVEGYMKGGQAGGAGGGLDGLKDTLGGLFKK